MFKGFYTAASGMLAQQRKTEMLSNNMANSNTPGYKADQASLRTFPELLQQSVGKNEVGVVQKSKIGLLATGVYMQEALPNFKQGDVKQTDLSTDLALININVPGNERNTGGAIFFTMQSPDGEIGYSRNGNLTLDSEGYLTNGTGLYVLDVNNAPIQLSSSDFSVTADGAIVDSDGNTYQLDLRYTDSPEQLIKDGDGLYRLENAEELVSAYNAAGVDFQVKQGFLENSNVDLSRTMTEMMTAYRTFEANQKILQAYDKSMDKAANEIGKI